MMRLTIVYAFVIALTTVLCAAQELPLNASVEPSAGSEQIASPRDAVPVTFPPPDGPAPVGACDSYTMQNLPVLNLAQKTCYWRAQLVTGSAVFGAAFFGALAMAEESPKEWPPFLLAA
jgi:hypothetical protein